MQEFTVIVIVAGALFYLGRKFYLSTTKKSGCGPACGCEIEPQNIKMRSKT